MPSSSSDVVEEMDDANQKEIRDHNNLIGAMTRKQYSRNYRLKQSEYMVELKKQVKSLQAEVILQSPRIKYSEEENLLLRSQNDSIKEKLSASAAQLMLKQAEYRALKKESEAMKNFLRGCLQQWPQLLDNLNPRTIHLLYFMLKQSGPSDEMSPDDHHDDDQMPSCSDPTVEFGAGDACTPEREPYRFLD